MAAHTDFEVAAVATRRIDSLTEQHRDVLLHAIENVCNTTDARMTFAQILDGVPTIPLLDGGNPLMLPLPESHPSWTQHQQLCPGVLERLDRFRKSFQAGTIHLDSKAILAYQSAAPGSRLFNTRLIELVSRSIHQIAVEITLLNENFHKEDGMTSFTPPESDTAFWCSSPAGPPPTWFYLRWYKDFEKYPQGSGDMVGYWAENYIIGGVLLFDRRGEHSDQVFEMGGNVDKKEYLDFLQANADASLGICPLPLTSDNTSFDRVDPEEPILETGIYRDHWERLPLADDEPDERLRDVMTMDDYPRYLDWFDAQKRAAKRRDRIKCEQLDRQT
ncbi:hypothetical protein PWT90_08484 [Aphanocladium album]|nr:hypothetical protein PWT90_08484 [Aphanocladium album]